MYPIGALELNNTVPAGSFLTLHESKSTWVMSSAPWAMNLSLVFDRSLGVIQPIPLWHDLAEATLVEPLQREVLGQDALQLRVLRLDGAHGDIYRLADLGSVGSPATVP